MCYTLDMQILRSSDIGNYLYCRRAWWYRGQGYESGNQTEMASGTELHRKHGRKVMIAGLYRALGFVLILIALTLLVTYCTARML